MNEAYENASTPEEKTIYREKLEAFETKVEDARVFYAGRDTCNKLVGWMWHCDYRGLSPSKLGDREFRSLEALVRAYERDNMSCGCARESDIQRSVAGW